MSSPNILIVAEREPLRALAEDLRNAGFRVTTTHDTEEAAPLAKELAPAVVLLGEPLPSSDSLEVCRQIRVELGEDKLPIFVLAPEERPHESVRGTLGRVDSGRLVQGIRSLLGSPIPATTKDQISAGILTIDRLRHQAAVDGNVIPLTLTEFRMIWTLAQQPGFVVTRQQLSDACRRDDNAVQERTIDVHIKSIRRKLGRHANLVETVRGVGYRLSEATTDAAP